MVRLKKPTRSPLKPAESPRHPRSPDIPDNWARDNLHLLEFMADGKTGQAGRSWLTHMEPIGLGTALVESFSSYITRLAYRHSVTELDLLELAAANAPAETSSWNYPRSARRMLGMLIGGSPDINGRDRLAVITRLGLEVLTRIRTLHRLNAAPLEAFALPEPILRGPAAWCPYCFHDWRNGGRQLYEPLLWKLAVVTYCPIHGQPLLAKCPTCHMTGRHLGNLREIGWCEVCKSWTGRSMYQRSAREIKEVRQSTSARQEAFTSLQAGILLAFISADLVEWLNGDLQTSPIVHFEFGRRWDRRLSPNAVGDRLVRLTSPSRSEPARQLDADPARASRLPVESPRRNARRDGVAQGRT
jgi:hypothetical protein